MRPFPLHPDSVAAVRSVAADSVAVAPDSTAAIATPALLAAPAAKAGVPDADGHLWQRTVAVVSGRSVPDSTAGQAPVLATVAVPSAQGYAGTPTPYAYRNDNGITAIILACLLLAAIVLSRSGFYLTHRLREMLHAHSHSADDSEHTENEVGGFIALTGMTCMLWGLMYYDYLLDRTPAIAGVGSPYVVVALAAGGMAVYYAAKFSIYSAVNAVFFSARQRREWAETYLLQTVATGVLLIPLVLAVAYQDLTPHRQAVYSAVVVALGKLVLFYRSGRTFFNGRGAWVHNFLYFCTLEVIPALLLWRALLWAAGKAAIQYLFN